MSALSEFLATFPTDIQEKAWSEVNGSHGYIDSTEGAVTIARAILAERQRCADIVGSYGTTPGQSDGKTGAFRKHRHLIRSAILGTI